MLKKILVSFFLFSLVICGHLVAQDKKAVQSWGTIEEGKNKLLEIQERFKAFQNRYPGAEGNKKFSDFLETEFARIAGKENTGSVAFRQPVFVSGSFFVVFEDGTKVPIYPLEPNLIDVSNFENSINEYNLVYGNLGAYHDIDGVDLKGSAIILQMRSYAAWQDVVPLGVQAIFFLEDDEYISRDTDYKVSDAPLTMPRFFIRKEDQERFLPSEGQQFSHGTKIKIEVEKKNAWVEKKDLKNHYAYIEGKNPDRVVVISSHYDTNGFVPSLSVNAADDVNLALLLHLMENFKENQPSVSVLFVAFNGFYRGQVGPSEFFWFSFADDALLEQEESFYKARLNLYTEISNYYAEYSPEKLEDMRDLSAKINGRIFAWKKPIIDLLRGEQNHASEQIMNLTYSMKKASDRLEVIKENQLKLKDLSEFEKHQWEILNKGSSESFDDVTDLQSLQSFLFKIDYEIESKIKTTQILEEELLKLTRNFLKKENEGRVQVLHGEITKSLDQIHEDMLLRRKAQTDLKKVNTSEVSESDHLQLEYIQYKGDYIQSLLALHDYRQAKTDSITIQKLFNSNFSEQLFISEKAGEERKLIDPAYIPKIKEYFSKIYQKSLGYKQAADWEVQNLTQNKMVRRFTTKKSESNVAVPKCVMVFDLNLTYQNDRFGLFSELSIAMNVATPVFYGRSAPGEFKEAGAFINNALNLSRNVLKNEGEDKNLLNCIVNTTTTTRFNTFVLRNCMGVQGEAKTAGIPALVFVTTEDQASKDNTTLNDYRTIDPQNLINLWNYLSKYIPLVLNESDFIQTTLQPYLNSYSTYIFNFVQQDNLAISVPETPVADVLFMFGGQPTSTIAGLGARTYHGSGYWDRKILASNAMGTLSIRNIRKLGVYGYEAYKYDSEHIHITDVMDMQKGAKTFKNDLRGISDNFKDFTVPIFPCEKIDLYDIFDYAQMSRYLSVRVLDGVQNSMPDNICVSGMPILGGHSWVRSSRVNGGFAIFKKPESTIKLILDNKILLNSLSSEDKKSAIGVGYNKKTLDRKSIAQEAFKDALRLNNYRNDLLISKGVKDSLVKQLNDKADTYYEESNAFLASHDYTKASKDLYTGFGMVYASYPKILRVMNDMIKAVVFYLALVIPFSFFVQRLCFPVTTIEKQLGFNVLVFFATFFAFRYIHPAFELTDAPLLVLIAFIQIVLAMFVFNVLYNKFDTRIKILQGRVSGGDSAGSNIVSQALIIGVNNMRKRKVRTILTCVTIILVTFTMLSFTSISTTVDPTMRRTDSKPTYSGIFYSKNSWSPIAADTFMQAFPNNVAHVKRAWFSRASAPFNIGFPEYDTSFTVSTFLGLEKAEEGFLGQLPISGRFFSSDDAREVILSSGMAEILKIDLADFKEMDVLIMGEKFRLVGFFDEKKMEELKDIRGTSILPQQPVGKAPSASDMQELDESTSDGNNNFRAMNPKMLGIIPYRTAILLGGHTVSVSLKYDDIEKLWQDTKLFTTFSNENIYFSTAETFKPDPDAPSIRTGVFFIGSGFSTSIGGLTDLIIPLIISATIIMNTMLGTVFERKKEIEIYTAVGLNPTQIGLFFIAEALVYGIIGSVSGYLIGQGASKVINKYHLLEGIDLNFSSLLVVYVMVFTILIVVLSTIYPAFTAVKAAQPSGNVAKKSDLKIEDNRLEQLYPFSFTEAKRYAINAYLRDYILKFADASTGSFMSHALSVSRGEYYDSHTDFTTSDALIQKFDIALTPYDLGVTEIVEVVTFYHPKVNAYMLKMAIHRVSGTDSNFLRTNQPFTDEIRKLLLRWHVEPLAEQEKFQIKGEMLFEAISSNIAEVVS